MKATAKMAFGKIEYNGKREVTHAWAVVDIYTGDAMWGFSASEKAATATARSSARMAARASAEASPCWNTSENPRGRMAGKMSKGNQVIFNKKLNGLRVQVAECA